MYNGMKVPCPKCNPKGHKSESKTKYISDSPICELCLGAHYLDWLELATGRKRRTNFNCYSFPSCSSENLSSKPLHKKDSYIKDIRKGVKQNWIKQ